MGKNGQRLLLLLLRRRNPAPHVAHNIFEPAYFSLEVGTEINCHLHKAQSSDLRAPKSPLPPAAAKEIDDVVPAKSIDVLIELLDLPLPHLNGFAAPIQRLQPFAGDNLRLLRG